MSGKLSIGFAIRIISRKLTQNPISPGSDVKLHCDKLMDSSSFKFPTSGTKRLSLLRLMSNDSSETQSHTDSGMCRRLHSLKLKNFKFVRSRISIGSELTSSASLARSGFLEMSRYSRLCRSDISGGIVRRLLILRTSFLSVVSTKN